MNFQQFQSERFLILLSFFCIYFIWGSTYLATDWAFESFPPFFMTGVRLLVAGSLLFIYSHKQFQITTKKQVQNAAFFGLLILAIGAGASMFSVVYLDTGMASLMIGCEPLVLVLLTWLLMGKRPSMQKVIGVALGMLGMYILVTQEQITTSPDAYIGVLAAVVSMLGWSIGALYMKGSDMPKSQVMSTAIQMLSGGLALLLLSFVIQEDIASIPAKFQWSAFFSFLYLMIFGSLIAYSAFSYLLVREDPRKVATATYINPIIALFLGWYFNQELLTLQSLLASVILISGVVFIIRDEDEEIEGDGDKPSKRRVADA